MHYLAETRRERKLTLLLIGASEFAKRIGNLIEQHEYSVVQASSARDAVSHISRGGIGLVLLDLTEGRASLELADTLLGLPSCPPIVVLDSEPSTERLLAAMRIGITDCLFVSEGDHRISERLKEHLDKAQARAHIHSSHASEASKTTNGRVESHNNGTAHGLAGLDLNAARRILTIENVPIMLSSIELSLIELLMQRAPGGATYEEMARVAFPTTKDIEHALRLLRPHIARLRRKFESVHNARWRIVNMRRQGYALRRIGAPIDPVDPVTTQQVQITHST